MPFELSITTNQIEWDEIEEEFSIPNELVGLAESSFAYYLSAKPLSFVRRAFIVHDYCPFYSDEVNILLLEDTPAVRLEGTSVLFGILKEYCEVGFHLPDLRKEVITFLDCHYVVRGRNYLTRFEKACSSGSPEKLVEPLYRIFSCKRRSTDQKAELFFNRTYLPYLDWFAREFPTLTEPPKELSTVGSVLRSLLRYLGKEDEFLTYLEAKYKRSKKARLILDVIRGNQEN